MSCFAFWQGCGQTDINESDMNNAVSSANIQTNDRTINLLFRESYNGTELGSLVYDTKNDYLFLSLHKETNSNNCYIRRYEFSDSSLTTVFKEDYCTKNYGLRIFNEELWVIGTLDRRLLRLRNLNNDNLTYVGYFPSGIWGTSNGGNDNLTEIGDITIVNGNIYYVSHDVNSANQNNGIQILYGDQYKKFGIHSNENWKSDGGIFRSIISTNDGSNSKLIVSTGFTHQKIQLWDLSGSKLNEIWGDISHLDKDSKGRIYFYRHKKIYRFSNDLNSKEEFPIIGDFDGFSAYGNEAFGNRIAVREINEKIQIIITENSSIDPYFYFVYIPF